MVRNVFVFVLLLSSAAIAADNIPFVEESSKWKSGVYATSEITEAGVKKTSKPVAGGFIPAPNPTFGTIGAAGFSPPKTHTATHDETYGGATTHIVSTSELWAKAIDATNGETTNSYIQTKTDIDGDVHVPNNWPKTLCASAIGATGSLLQRQYKLLTHPAEEFVNLARVDFTFVAAANPDEVEDNLERDIELRLSNDNNFANLNAGSFFHAQWVQEDDGGIDVGEWLMTYRLYNSSGVSTKLSKEADESTHTAGANSTYSFTVEDFDYSRTVATHQSVVPEGSFSSRIIVGKTDKPFVNYPIWVGFYRTILFGCSSGSTTTTPYDADEDTNTRSKINVRWVRPISQY